MTPNDAGKLTDLALGAGIPLVCGLVAIVIGLLKKPKENEDAEAAKKKKSLIIVVGALMVVLGILRFVFKV